MRYNNRMRAAFAAALAALAALAAPARAVFIADEMDVIDAEPLYDSEYFLDLLAFTPPLDWRWQWEEGSAGYRINGASLDRSDLLLEQEVRFARRITEKPPELPGVDFGYHLQQRGDKDLQELHQWVSVEAGPWGGLSFGVFGEPTFAKEDADIGFSLKQRLASNLFARATMNRVDWNLNERGSSGAHYDRKPKTYGAEIVWTPRYGRFALISEFDTPLVRRESSQNKTYSYRRTRAGATWSAPRTLLGVGILAGYHYEAKREGQTFAPDPSSLGLRARRQVHSFILGAMASLTDKDQVEAGLEGLWRKAEADSVSGASHRYRRWEAHPYGRWRRTLKPWAVSEAAVFLGAGERRQYGAAPQYESPVNAKLGLGIDFLFFKSNGRIGFNTNYDLDDLGNHIWDGGNVRAQFLF